jgi:anaerobic selenocysteine-containing dehydrogenase/ferredoxin-NADP reductase
MDSAGEAQTLPREVKGFCTLCRSRCGSINVIENGRLIEVRPNPAHPTGKALCPKGRAAPEIVHSAERLLHPLRRTNDKRAAVPEWRPVTWKEALDDIAARMKEIAERNGPEAIAFAMTSASASSISDVRAWLERFVWSFGSPNICASSELCNWHKDFTHALTFGRGISTPDYANTDLAVLWGHNPSNVWLAQANALADGRARGAELVVIDPRRTQHAAEADLWLRVTPGTDGILAIAVASRIVETGRYDQDFVRCWTNGPFLVRRDTGLFLRASEVALGPATNFVVFDVTSGRARAYDPARRVSPEEGQTFALAGEFELHGSQHRVEAQPAFAIFRRALSLVSLEAAAATTGVPASQIIDFAEGLSRAKSVSYYCWTGTGQHVNSTQIDRAIATLFALKGQVDTPGGNIAWAAPRINPIDDLSLLSSKQRAKALGLAERPLGPASRCYVTAGDLYRAILEEKPYRVRGLVAFGSNPLVSRGDPDRGRQALQCLDLHVHCDLFMNPTASTADYILPVGSAWEREALRVGFEISAAAQSLIQLRPAMIPPVGESRSEFWIAAELAKRLGCGAALFDGNLTAANDYVLAPTGLTVEKLRAAPEGVSLPTQDAVRSYATATSEGVRGFATPTRRVEFYCEALHRHGQPPVPDGGPLATPDPQFPLILTNAKFGHLVHTQHRHIASLRRRSVEPQFSLAPEAAGTRGISEGDPIEVRTRYGAVIATARIDSHLDKRTVVGEFGWWQACDDLGAPSYPISGPDSSNYNVLASGAPTDAVSHTPPVRSLACEITRVAEAPQRWPGFAPLEVASVRRETDAVSIIELRRPDGHSLPAFRCGQFISVKTGESLQPRSYSLIGPAEPRPDRYLIAVKREPGGDVSPRMVLLQPGDSLVATVPSGQFTLPLRNRHPVVLIAFGIGVTPFMSLLETIAATGTGPEITLCHAAPVSQAQPFRSRLQKLQALIPGLNVVSYLSRIGTGRRFSAATLPQEMIDRRARFYICGSPASTRDTRTALLARGVPRFEIFVERFESPRAIRGPEINASHKIALMRSGREIVWTGDQGSVLEALTRHGITMPSGCRVGQCESCAVRLLRGTVGYSEPPADLGDGLCLTCSAIPASDITLDA